jgi:hypothetical protein
MHFSILPQASMVLASAVAVTSLQALPALSQAQPSNVNIQRARPGITTLEPERLPLVDPQTPIVIKPVEPVTADEDLPLDDPWITFCLIHSDPGEDLANCIDGLP